MKNLILMHLESLNNINYRVNEERFQFLHEFEKNCESYSNYYSTATSTLMVLSDLQYGSMKPFEACKSLGDVPEGLSIDGSMFDELSEQGYATSVMLYPPCPDTPGAEKRCFLGKNIHAEETTNYDVFISEIDRTIVQEKFALHLVPVISNVAENRAVDITANDESTYWDEGYCVLNNIVEYVIKKLEELNKLKDTVIIFYGDHGDDFWGHGMHGGLTHAIEPNNLMISTPLFIWKGKETIPGKKDDIIQTSDLREIAMNCIQGKSYKSERKYAFSRNEYVGQDVRQKTFNKGYAVVDGRYLLLVTFDGLELYDTVIDPTCHTNLLWFFEYKKGVLEFNIDNKNDYGFHIRSFWSARQRRIVRDAFYSLYDSLLNELNELYQMVGLEKIDQELKLKSVKSRG